jgi:hypothetical protein
MDSAKCINFAKNCFRACLVKYFLFNQMLFGEGFGLLMDYKYPNLTALSITVIWSFRTYGYGISTSHPSIPLRE